jgi:hypothetical protein
MKMRVLRDLLFVLYILPRLVRQVQASLCVCVLKERC